MPVNSRPKMFKNAAPYADNQIANWRHDLMEEHKEGLDQAYYSSVLRTCASCGHEWFNDIACDVVLNQNNGNKDPLQRVGVVAPKLDKDGVCTQGDDACCDHYCKGHFCHQCLDEWHNEENVREKNDANVNSRLSGTDFALPNERWDEGTSGGAENPPRETEHTLYDHVLTASPWKAKEKKSVAPKRKAQGERPTRGSSSREYHTVKEE